MTSDIHSSPAAQWLQGLLAKGAPSQIGSPANTGSTQWPRDTSRISAQAFQLNQAAGTSLKAQVRTAQSSGVSAAHHHRHLHNGDHTMDTSLVSSAVNASISNLKGSARTDGPPISDMLAGSVAHDSRERSFIQKHASKVANDLRLAYSQGTAPEAASTHNNRAVRPLSVTV